MADALRAVGVSVEVHRDHFNSDADDTEWIVEVGKRGWIILTKDRGFRNNPLEIAALLKSGVPSFVMTSASTTGPQNAANLIQALPEMMGLIKKLQPPFLATITDKGRVNLQKSLSGLIKDAAARCR